MSINKSLLTLGKVISALSKQYQNGKKTFIPYRESVLTWYVHFRIFFYAEVKAFSDYGFLFYQEASLPLPPSLSNDLWREEISLLHQVKNKQDLGLYFK